MTPTTLQQVLDSFSRTQTLQCLAELQRRQARDAVILDLLQSRLCHLTSAPAQNHDDELLTVPEVAERLRVKKSRAYELCRTKVIPSVRLGVRQIRVRRRDLDHALARRPTQEGA